MNTEHRKILPAPVADEAREAGSNGAGNKWLDAERAQAVEADWTRGSAGDLREYWVGILSGQLVVVDYFDSPTRWYLVVEKRSVTGRLQADDRQLLTALVLGASHKCAAIERGVSQSKISTSARHILETIGLRVSSRRIPPALTLLARASMGDDLPGARISHPGSGTSAPCILSFERPELRLKSALSPAELTVIGLLLDGHSYAEIAAQRGRSVRTIANQVSGAFRRLGISGRSELIERLTTLGTGRNIGRGPDGTRGRSSVAC